MPPLPWADLIGAWQAALNLSAALVAQTQGAPGQRRVCSMSDALDEAQSLLRAQYKHDQKKPTHGSNLFSGVYPCYRLYRAGCGKRVAVGAIEEKFWIKVCAILGLPQFGADRMASGDRGAFVSQQIAEAFVRRPWREWDPLFDEADCCVEPVIEYSEMK